MYTQKIVCARVVSLSHAFPFDVGIPQRLPSHPFLLLPLTATPLPSKPSLLDLLAPSFSNHSLSFLKDLPKPPSLCLLPLPPPLHLFLPLLSLFFLFLYEPWFFHLYLKVNRGESNREKHQFTRLHILDPRHTIAHTIGLKP